MWIEDDEGDSPASLEDKKGGRELRGRWLDMHDNPVSFDAREKRAKRASRPSVCFAWRSVPNLRMGLCPNRHNWAFRPEACQGPHLYQMVRLEVLIRPASFTRRSVPLPDTLQSDSGNFRVCSRNHKTGLCNSCLCHKSITRRAYRGRAGPKKKKPGQFYQFHQYRWEAFSVILAAFLATLGL